MKCTKCSRPITPIVAVDIDGTLGDYHGHFIKFALQYLDLPGMTYFKDYDGGSSFKKWAMSRWDIDERTWNDIKLAYRQGGMKRSMPLYPYADKLCRLIKDLDCELWLTTTRPFLRLDNIDPDTRHWLERNGITDYDGLLYDEAKYQKLAEYVDKDRVIAIVDDLPEMYDAAAAAFNWQIPILRRNQYNVACKGDGFDLDDVGILIKGRVKIWKENHK